MKKPMILSALSVPFLLAGALLAAGNNSIEAKATAPTVGDFEVIDGEGYVLGDNEISVEGTGSMLLEAETAQDFHLQTGYLTAEANSEDFGILVYAENDPVNGLTGDLFNIFYKDGSAAIYHGTVVNGVYSLCNGGEYLFGGWDGAKLDMYVEGGTVAFHMADWFVASFETVFDDGNTYLFSSDKTVKFVNPTISNLEYEIGNYLMRLQWGGFDNYGYSSCFDAGHYHQFDMEVPATLDLGTVEKLVLVRDTNARGWGQDADVEINGVKLDKGWGNLPYNRDGELTSMLLDIPASVVPTTGSRTLTFKTTSTGTEEGASFIVRSYALYAQIGGELICLDHMLFGSSVSEAAHNLSYDEIGWHNWQKLFINLIGDNAPKPTEYVACRAKGATGKFVGGFDLVKGGNLSLEFKKVTDANIDFFDLIDVTKWNGYTFRNELWIQRSYDSGAFKAADGHTFEHDLVEETGTYWLDFFFEPMPSQPTNSYKYTLTGSYTLTIDADVKAFAQTLLTKTEDFGACGTKAATWGEVKTAWEDLSDDQVALFKAASCTAIDDAKARYTCICGRGYEGIEDFIYEGALEVHNSLNGLSNNSNIILFVTALVALATVAFAGICVYRVKSKHEGK